jgi:hypothetical protein
LLAITPTHGGARWTGIALTAVPIEEAIDLTLELSAYSFRELLAD